MVEPHPARKVRPHLTTCSLPEHVSGNVPTTCRHHGISQPVYSTRLRRYSEEARQRLPSCPFDPATVTRSKIALQTRVVITIRDRPTRPQRTGETPTRLGVNATPAAPARVVMISSGSAGGRNTTSG